MYKTVSFPKDLHATIEEFIKAHPELGYRTPTEFIIDASRRLYEKQLVFVLRDIKHEKLEP